MGRDNTVGYHVVNLLVHLVITWFVFLTIKTLLTSSRFQNKYRQQAYFIALLTATLWAANPIQTQAVTYIIQRMASLATLFYLVGIFCYVQGRRTQPGSHKIAWYCGCLVSYLLAVGSKENAVMMPLALGLIEIIFYQDLDQLKANKRFVGAVVLTGVSVLLAGVVLFVIFKGDPIDYFQRRYADRPFSLGQRLVTEPRVLVLYLSQLFYPVPDRLSVVHDIEISTGLFVPWTTLPAIGLVAGLIGIGLQQASKRPLIAFGILFYFLNHVVESTIFPLELAFEHRNYLPSLFIFMAPAAGLIALIDKYRHSNKAMAIVLSVGITILIVTIGLGTYTRNMVWRTQKSLWQDIAHKNPNLARPLQKLAEIYHRAGEYEKAMALYAQALNLKDPRPQQSRNLSLNNMGNIYYAQGLYGQAIQSFETILTQDTTNERARFNLALALVADNRLEAALAQVEILVQHKQDHPKFLNLKGHILIKLNRPQEALQYFREALRSAPEHRNTLLNLGVAYKAIGDHAKADWFLTRADQLYPDDTMIILRLVENALIAGKHSDAERYWGRLFEKNSVLAIARLLNSLPNQARMLPIEHDRLMQSLKTRMDAKR